MEAGGHLGGVGPGAVLDGFEIEALAGRGGMGVVYRARQRRPTRVVALKVIATDLADDPQFRARFERESAIAAQIEHPNVIPVYAVGESGGVLYIAMRFVDGVDLRTLLDREGRLAPQRAAAITDQVAQALDAAHAHGLVHRDVKPANILISSVGGREHVYLTDFGLSRHVVGSKGLTGTGAFLGTIDYVAPEQARGERVDAQSDVYALGCVLFHALTGTVPFPMDNELAKLYAHNATPPPSVLEHAADLPAELDAVCARAMAKAREQRYLSAGDLGRAALAAAAGTPTRQPERSVAIGAAAPQAEAEGRTAPSPARDAATQATRAPAPPPGTATSDAAPAAHVAAPRRRRRRGIVAGIAVLAAAGVAAAIVAFTIGGEGGESGESTTTIISEHPAPALHLPKVRGLRIVEAQQGAAPGGYQYRLVLSAVRPPRGATVGTRVPYYLTLLVRRGSGRFVTVHRLKLPYPFTASSTISQFDVGANDDGSGNAMLSWYVRQGDEESMTEYFTLTPNRINLN